MHRTIAFVAAASSVALFATLAAVMGFSATLAAAADPDGAALFAKHCSSCHGMDGAADTPAGKALKAVVLKDPKFANIDPATVVHDVRTLPPHKAVSGTVKDPEIEAIAGYIHQLASGGESAPE